MLDSISCYLLDVVRETLESCNYNECNDICKDYLLFIDENCPCVFDNDQYRTLWETLVEVCFGGGH